MLNHNSSEYPVFRDGTSTANASGFDETTAPSGNLASMMRNWIVVTSPPLTVQEQAIPPLDKGKGTQPFS